MLELRPNCENCDKELGPNSLEARICSFECTYCHECVEGVLKNVCPNCGGGFVERPIRPKDQLLKYPSSLVKVLKPIKWDTYQQLQDKNVDIPVNER